MGGYRIVYDIGIEGYQEWPLVWVAAGLAAATVLLHLRCRATGRSRATAHLLGAITLAFASVACAITAWDYGRLAGALNDGRTAVVEGPIRDHQTQRVRYAEGKRRTLVWESFVVGTTRFGYYRDDAAYGFRNAGARTLDIREGIRVRVHYVDDPTPEGVAPRILRLEAAASDLEAMQHASAARW